MAQAWRRRPIGAEEIELDERAGNLLVRYRNAKVRRKAAAANAGDEITGTRHRWNRYRRNNKRIPQHWGSGVIDEIGSRRSVDTHDGASVRNEKESRIIAFQWSVVETRRILLILREGLVILGSLAARCQALLRR